MRRCRDCEPGTNRPAPHPGPRCATHHKAQKRRQKEAAWARRLWETYRITPDQYWAIYEKQGGVCFGCQRARGTGPKKLSVDHDHKCCRGTISCGKCVRGLLCSPCNKGVLAHLRDEVVALYRFIDYLEYPPAREVLSGDQDSGNRGA